MSASVGGDRESTTAGAEEEPLRWRGSPVATRQISGGRSCMVVGLFSGAKFIDAQSTMTQIDPMIPQNATDKEVSERDQLQDMESHG